MKWGNMKQIDIKKSIQTYDCSAKFKNEFVHYINGTGVPLAVMVTYEI